MKKSYKWHHKWDEEEHPRDHQRQRSNPEEPRKFSQHDSSRYGEDYFEDENKSVGYQRNSYQMERRSTKTTVETFKVIAPRFQAFKKVNCSTNSTEEQQCLNDDHEENYKVRQGAHPLSPKENSYSDSKNQIFKDVFSKPVGVRMKSENEFPQVDNTKSECFSTRRNSNEININEGNPSKYDMKHMHSCNENSLSVLQKYSTSLYESNQSAQYYSKQHDDQSNTNSHDLSQNVSTYQERPNSQSDNMCNGFQSTAFLSHSASHERYEFSMLKLIDLLYYNANLMQDQALFNFSTAVKCKILETIDKFPYPMRGELEVLCEITDGDQSEKNQQIITTRTCRIVRNIIEKFPHVLSTLETPPPPPTQILVYQTLPNLHGMTNISSDSEAPFLKIVQNSEILLTSTTDCNLMSNYKIAQNDKCVISKTISDSFDNTNSNDYKDSCEIHNFNTNDVENNSTINSSLIAEENKNIVEESSKHHSSPPLNSGEHKSVLRFSFNEDDNGFASFELDKLLNFNIDAMHGDVVFKHAFFMKQRILEKINSFKDPYKDKLKLLCELTDGTQREHNQKLINERMCDLIYDFKNEIGQSDWENFLKEQSKDVHTRSHDENEMLRGHRQNVDEQSRKMHPRRSHDEDEVIHEHRQNFTDEQSRNAHPRRSHQVVHEHRRNFSDVQSRNAHSRRSHEVVHEHRQNITDEQSNKVHSRRLHYSDEMVQHQHTQNFSDGQSRNIHLRRSHYKDGTVQQHRENVLDGQSKNAHRKSLHYSDVKKR